MTTIAAEVEKAEGRRAQDGRSHGLRETRESWCFQRKQLFHTTGKDGIHGKAVEYGTLWDGDEHA